MGFRVKGLVPLDIVLESRGIITKKKCFNGEIEDMAKAARSPSFTLETERLPNFFHRRVVIAGVIECEISYLVDYAVASKDLSHVGGDITPRMAVDKLMKAKYKLSWLAKGVEKVATDSIQSVAIIGPPTIERNMK
ncbi:hypothetical protein HZS61_002249 [Fusarium oxysporum f. sp. conglutinans]|uniref:Uncharacterized protein n=1 Tax=Fusarium oxysporum f. sp. conglutinans TaxID=100902 RepID=A0A8H6GIL9_FUSOX|nr:hypothetical protein HZS61_002249 [Fusarium oxysporum f. sp. conglutinans]